MRIGTSRLRSGGRRPWHLPCGPRSNSAAWAGCCAPFAFGLGAAKLMRGFSDATISGAGDCARGSLCQAGSSPPPRGWPANSLKFDACGLTIPGARLLSLSRKRANSSGTMLSGRLGRHFGSAGRPSFGIFVSVTGRADIDGTLRLGLGAYDPAWGPSFPTATLGVHVPACGRRRLRAVRHLDLARPARHR
jgi:hypothetical protein